MFVKSISKGLTVTTTGSIVLFGKIIEEFFLNELVGGLSGIIWAVGVVLLIVGLFIFPFKSFKNPTSYLECEIIDIWFYSIFKYEPYIEIKIKLQNKADINQIIKALEGNLHFSSFKRDDNPKYNLNHSFKLLFSTKIKARDSVEHIFSIPVSSELVEELKKRINNKQETSWYATNIIIDASCRILNLERGKQFIIERCEYTTIPKGLTLEEIEAS